MVKLVEEKVFKELKVLVENVVRIKVFENKFIIIILRCEYDYLIESVVGVREMVDKKVVVVYVWVEVLKVSEREIRIKILLVERDIKEMMWNEE